MAIIYSYPLDANPTTSDLLLGSSSIDGKPTKTFTIGNGTVNATVSKTAPTGQASGNGVITWNKNGSLQNTYTFSSGDYVYSSYTYTGVSNGDTLQTIITEN